MSVFSYLKDKLLNDYNKTKNAYRSVSSFVRQNPTPYSYVQNRVPQIKQVVQPTINKVQNFVPRINTLNNRIASNPIAQKIKSGTELLTGVAPTKKIFSEAGNMARDIARQGGALRLTVQNKPSFTPTTRLQKAVLGTEPIKSAQTGTVSSYLQGKGVSPKTSKVLGGLVLGGSVASNFVGWGEGENALAKGLTKINKAEEVKNALKGFSVSDELASKIAKSTKAEEISGMLKGLKGVDALSNEARKYKTTVNLQNKDDANYLARILGEDRVKQLQSGDYSFHRNPDNTIKYWEDAAKVNIISEKPQTIAESLKGKIKSYDLKNKTVYHGTTADNTQNILSQGFKSGAELSESAYRGGGHGELKQGAISFSTDEKMASRFTGTSPNGVVFEAKLKPESKVVTVKGVDYAEDLNDLIPELRKQGIDAVYLEGEKEVAVINKNAVKPSGRYQEFNVKNGYSQPLSTPKTGGNTDAEFKNAIAYIKQWGTRQADVNAIRKDFPGRTAEFDKAISEIKASEATKRALNAREQEYGNKLNALANNAQLMNDNLTLNSQAVKDFQKAEYELAKQYPDIAPNADKIAYYEKTHPVSPKTAETDLSKLSLQELKSKFSALPYDAPKEEKLSILNEITTRETKPKTAEAGAKVGQEAKDTFYNVDRLNISDKAKTAIKTEISKSKAQIEKVVGTKLTNEEVLAKADETSKVLNSTVTKEQTANKIASNLKLRQEISAKAEKGFATKKDAEDFIDLWLKDKAAGEDIARQLQARRINADPQETEAINLLLDSIRKTGASADDIKKAASKYDLNDPEQLANFYREFVKPNAEDWIDVIRYNSMLSSPTTHLVNFHSNVQGSAIIRPIEKTITGILDATKSALTGSERTAYAGEGLQYTKAYYSNLATASKKLWNIMTGKEISNMQDIYQIPLTKKGTTGRVVENVLKYPARLLQGMDELFTSMGTAGELKALEYRAEKSGKEIANIGQKAYGSAKKVVFNAPFNLPEEGKVLKALEYLPSKIKTLTNSENPIVRTVSKFTMPFVRIGSNLLKQGVEYSPVGITTLWGATNKTEQLAKWIIGMAATTGAATLLGTDRLTWAEPTSEEQKNAFRAAGKQAYSVKIGNYWVSYNKLHPAISFNLALVAAVDDAMKNKLLSDSDADAILSAAYQFGTFFTDQSYMKNVGDIVNATKSGESYLAKLGANYASQLIPMRAMLSYIERIVDPYQRQVDKNGSVLKKQMQYIIAQIPGLASSVPERVDSFGNKITNQLRGLNAISPYKITQERTTTQSQQNAEYLQQLQNKSKATKEYNQLKKDIEKGNSSTGQIADNMWQLSDGSIKSKIGDEWKSFDSQKEAQKALDKYDFEQSGKKTAIINGRYWYLDSAGEGKSYTETEYNSKLLTAKMDQAKNQNDVNSWLKLANEQLASIEQQYNDAQGDELTQLGLQNDYTDLLEKIQKYASYGGFTKGKSGKKARILTLKAPSISSTSGKISLSKPTLSSIKTGGTSGISLPRSTGTTGIKSRWRGVG